MSYASIPSIENLCYQSAKNVFANVINGNVYKPETRPNDSNLEDIVVKVSTGNVRQIQEFIAYINVFVPDIDNKSRRKVMNRKRLDELMEYEDELIADLNEANVGLYEATLKSPTSFVKVRDIEQSFVSFNINIKCLTFNL